jgi:hypothetical protein
VVRCALEERPDHESLRIVVQPGDIDDMYPLLGEVNRCDAAGDERAYAAAQFDEPSQEGLPGADGGSGDGDDAGGPHEPGQG